MVTEPATKSALAEIYRGGCLSYLQKGVVEEQDPQTRHVYESALQLATTIEHVPVLVIPCIERRFDGAPLIAAATAFGSILPAAWSFLLALRSRGLGSVWTTAHLWDESDGGRGSSHPRHRHAGGDVPGGAHHRDRLPAGEAAAARDGHVLGIVGRDAVNGPVPPLLRPRSSDEYAPVPWDTRLHRTASTVAATADRHAHRLGITTEAYHGDRRGLATALRALDAEAGGGFYPVPVEAEHDVGRRRRRVRVDRTGRSTCRRTSSTPTRWHGDGAAALAGFLQHGRPRPLGGAIDPHAHRRRGVGGARVRRDRRPRSRCSRRRPGDADHNVLTNPQIAAARDVVDRYAGTGRVLTHTIVHPNLGAAELDAMVDWHDALRPVGLEVLHALRTADRRRRRPAAGSSTTTRSASRSSSASRARARASSPSHKGLGGPIPDASVAAASPRDIGPAAAAFPDINVRRVPLGLRARSRRRGRRRTTRRTPTRGVDRLVESLADAGHRRRAPTSTPSSGARGS